MKLSMIVLLSLYVLFGGALPAHARAVGGGSTEDDFAVADNLIAKWAAQDGKKVRTLTVNGLRRTRRTTIEWMVGTKEGQPFKATALAADLQVLYNTGNLYDLTGDVLPVEGDMVDVTITLKDKWTLFPVVGGQGGGGSLTLGGGIYESNLLGYMANASVFVWTFNGTTSYDVNMNQEYFHGTQTMWSLDVQDSIEPQEPRNYDNSSNGTFAWRRQQKEIMLGTHTDWPLRAMFYANMFRDSIFQSDPHFYPVRYDGLQQRFYPKFIYGRVDWTNYLEDGFELTMQPSVANVFGGGPTYAQIELDFKRVFIVGPHRQDNVAFYVSTSHMGPGGPNYLYNVGGYYNVRGYTDMREYGRHVAFANAEYRTYLFGHRWDFLGLDLMAVQGAVFTDVGSGWGDSSLTGDARAADFRPLWSAGAGLRINMVKFAGAILRLDVARTISPDEGLGFSFGIGQFF